MTVLVPPDNLYEFLQRKGHTLLIKGDAGTGKTTFALELLRMLGEGGKGVYLSTRVSPRKLYIQFDWLKDIVKPGYLISTTYTREETIFDDVRLGDAKYILEKVLDVLKTPVIVFDTWDGIAKEMEKKDRVKTEKSLIAMLDASDSIGIFISEEPQKTTLEYLVDGIVTLSQSEIDSRRIREIELNKLRGTRISRHRFVFTLNDGRFRYFPPYEQKPIEKVVEWKPVPDGKDYFSTGSEDLDKMLGGGYPRGSHVLLEADVSVPISAIRLVVCGVILNFLSQDRCATSFPTGGSSWEEVIGTIVPYIQHDKLDKFMRIYKEAEVGEGQAKPYVIHLNVKPDLEEDYKLWVETQNELMKRTGQPLLKTHAFDALEIRYFEQLDKLFKVMSNEMISCRNTGGLVLAIVRPNLTITGRAINMAKVHLRMVERDGSIILYGVKPNTLLHVLESDVSKGYPKARLTPIV